MTNFTPWTWPQDNLQIPPGQGLMTDIEGANARITKREGKTFAASFDFAAATAPAPVETRIISTDQDGDFWCQNIYLSAFRYDVAPPPEGMFPFVPSGSLSIADARTGNPITMLTGVPLRFLAVNLEADGTGAPASVPPPIGWRSTSTLIQPFCFTRNGAIEVAIAGLPNIAEDMWLQVAFGGWTEYAHASR